MRTKIYCFVGVECLEKLRLCFRVTIFRKDQERTTCPSEKLIRPKLRKAKRLFVFGILIEKTTLVVVLFVVLSRNGLNSPPNENMLKVPEKYTRETLQTRISNALNNSFIRVIVNDQFIRLTIPFRILK